MPIRNDYLQDMIGRFASGLARSVERSRAGLSREAREGYEGVAGEVLDMDPETVLALSPASLVTMLQISAVDDRLANYLAYALLRMAELDEAQGQEGSAFARTRRMQASAVADAYGFDVGQVPPELEMELGSEERKS